MGNLEATTQTRQAHAFPSLLPCFLVQREPELPTQCRRASGILVAEKPMPRRVAGMNALSQNLLASTQCLWHCLPAQAAAAGWALDSSHPHLKL